MILAPRIRSALATAVTALSVAGSIWAMSQWGFGTSPDSVVYVAGARSLATGAGFTEPSNAGAAIPIVHFPPLFSFLLATFSIWKIDALDGAAIMNAALLALNICLSAALVYRATGSVLAGFAAVLLTASAPAIVITHTMVWSEPLFLCLLLLTALAISDYSERQSLASLVCAWVPMMLAPLTRYAGFAVIVAAAISVARKNFNHALALLVAGSAGIALWMARNYSFSSSATGRRLSLHVPTIDLLSLAWQTVAEWFGGWPLMAVIAVLIVATLARRSRHIQSAAQSEFLLDFAVVYVLLIASTVMFFDAQTPLDRRILSPLYLSLSIWTIIKITTIAGKELRLAWLMVAVVLTLANSRTSLEWLKTLWSQGVQFSSAAWRLSPTIQYIKTQRLKRVYSNAPEAVFLLTGIPAAMLPMHTNAGTLSENPYYREEIAQMNSSGEVVVYFNAMNWRWYVPGEERLKTELSLSQVAALTDGAVYRINWTKPGGK